MTTYTFSEARQKFASVLEKARSEGKVMIKRKDGSLFVIHPVPKKDSPLDVKGVDLGLSATEIVDVIREIRER
ncbi:MAG: type II toxin-antitoxin system Phd/YefM family antitoxin [Desulfobacteraceae bacterium]|nr:type II toxin-antitoxin system Phd/YefM family antitoxin [Desulfobacteraceae bacterium]